MQRQLEAQLEEVREGRGEMEAQLEALREQLQEATATGEGGREVSGQAHIAGGRWMAVYMCSIYNTDDDVMCSIYNTDDDVMCSIYRRVGGPGWAAGAAVCAERRPAISAVLLPGATGDAYPES